ncbi:LacI family DNA-binding transcriptional regulator [Paenibacillus chartarius]|uniref:LacI family DNA-binding transcriptional regulator n=1 Tax=Paenibacillus chartarius TaxID=747481 RepID=A0ABV6DLV4_9BACL
MNLDDIAKKAGVSKSAVSFALNGKPGISAETRQRILQIAEEAGYSLKQRPLASDNAAKSLTFLVFANSGIVLEQYYQQPFFRELIHFIEERCRSQGYSLIFSTVDKEFFERDIRVIAEEKRSSGIILLGTNLTAEQVSTISEIFGTHLVVLDTHFDTLPVHFVGINNFMGAYQAGAYLTGMGHRTFGYIASNVRIHNFEERKRGFLQSLSEQGLEVPRGSFFSVAPTMLSSQDDLKRQLESHLQLNGKLPSAVFCECDYIAISAMKTLAELGISVPAEISVVGFDNITEAMVVSPELTTIHVEKERMAHLAVDMLIESLERGQQVKTKIKVDTRLVIRNSAQAAVSNRI